MGGEAGRALKGVWASKWNDRAFYSCRKVPRPPRTRAARCAGRRALVPQGAPAATRRRPRHTADGLLLLRCASGGHGAKGE